MNDDFIQTFQIEKSGLRGRIVRLGNVIDTMLARHNYPDPVARLTGEAALLALQLSSMLKYDGIFTLQAQGDGPVSMVVADVTEHGVVRACARFDAEKIDGSTKPIALMGRGHIAFTVDQGGDTERYQGIVSLTGDGLQDSIQHYFSQSEQIMTGVRIALCRVDGHWRGGGIMLQKLPDDDGGAPQGEATEDDWRRAMVLLQSCAEAEMTDPDLTAEDLLFRLYHEDGVRVYPAIEVRESCRCSQERADHIVAMMGSEERIEMTIDGKIVVTCEFCSRSYDVGPATPAAKSEESKKCAT